MTDSGGAVKAAHLAWETYHAQLRKQEMLLSAALAEYTAGRGELPLQMMEEVQAMRIECNKLFKALMTAMVERSRQLR